MRKASAYFLFFLFAFAGCTNEPEISLEKEVITTLTVTLTPSPATSGNVVKLTWDDINLDGIVDENELAVSGTLNRNLAYRAVLNLLNKTSGEEIDVSEKIKKEGVHHRVCLTKSDELNLSFDYTDKDRNVQPIGLESTWATTTASVGTVTVTVRHQPGVKTGDCPGYGETDVSVEFEISIANPL